MLTLLGCVAMRRLKSRDDWKSSLRVRPRLDLPFLLVASPRHPPPFFLALETRAQALPGKLAKGAGQVGGGVSPERLSDRRNQVKDSITKSTCFRLPQCLFVSGIRASQTHTVSAIALLFSVSNSFSTLGALLAASRSNPGKSSSCLVREAGSCCMCLCIDRRICVCVFFGEAWGEGPG